MKAEPNGVGWMRLLGENGWQWDSAKSYQEEYGFYEAQIFGSQYSVCCWARVSDGNEGYRTSGDWGVAWIECDISTYTSREYLTRDDAREIECAIDHAETNLLTCGIPFTDGYRFSGKNAFNKARRNAAIRRKYGLVSKEERLRGQQDED